jgi:hypothetical protein
MKTLERMQAESRENRDDDNAACALVLNEIISEAQAPRAAKG